MAKPVSRRKNVTYKGGRRIRLPDVPGIRHERVHWDDGLVVAGIDEVGRGAWAGPVTYAAVVLPSDRRMYKLRDSKQLDPGRREELAARIHDFAEAVSLGSCTNDEIDELGMSPAMKLGAKRALDGLSVRPDVVLIDGNWDFLRGCGTRNELIVHGDAHSASIAAASIVAKVSRDSEMVTHASDHPRFAFHSNKGYPSPVHRAALREQGPCVLHRCTWVPVAAALTSLGTARPD